MSTYAHWNFVLTDPTGRKIGEVLEADERSVTRALSGPSTANFKILVTNRLLTDVLTRDLNLMCLRNTALQFNGPLISVQLAADDPNQTPTVSCTATDPSWRFDRRLVGKSTTGTVFSSATDRLSIVETLINTANTENEMGIQTLGQTCGSTAIYTAGPYKKLSEVIADMGNTLSGFDWRVEPIEYNAGKIGRFRAAALLGNTRGGAVFEYQGRANMRVPNFTRDLSTSVNRVFSIPDEGPTSPLGVRQKDDANSQAARGLLEEVIDTSNITNVTLRDAVLDDHILYRKNPRQVLSFSPDFNDYSGRVPEWGIDYDIGDTVHARVLYNGATLVDGYVRIYKMTLDIDANNRETLTPTVVQEG